MTTEVTPSAAMILWSLEASARQHYEAMYSKGMSVTRGVAHVDLPSGERFMVEYNANTETRFYYREAKFQMLSPVENRTVALMALEQRLGEAVAS